MQRIERKSPTKPIRKDNLQASTLNQRFDSKFQELRDSVTSEADCVNGRNIAEHQLRVRVDLDPFDLLRALIGVSNVASSPDWQQSAKRLVDILITGSRPVK
jgi:hypothetical protein